MSLLKTGTVMEQITDALSILTVNVKLYNSRGLTDANKAAEDFYCGLLNIVLDAQLENMNLLKMDFPAIDLADRTNRICVQVTSTNDREKVEKTLTKFFAAKLEDTPLTALFDRLILLIIGEPKQYRTGLPSQPGFAFNMDEDIWGTSKLLSEIERLNHRRRQQVLNYLEENLKWRAAAPFVLELPVPEFRTPTGFLGREEELAQIRSAREKPVILRGLGGVGKTALAIQYSKEWPGKVFFLRFADSFCHTLADGVGRFLPDGERRGLEEDAVADKALALLAQGGPDSLLILDNAEKEGSRWSDLTRDPYYEKLRHLPLRLLMTTRMYDSGGISIASLPREQLYRIFRGHGLDLPQKKMDDLIDSVDGHTMTVDLIARTLREGGGLVSTDDILTAMRNSTLAQSDFDEVETDHERQQRQIYGHLRELFSLSGVTEEGRTALACATLLPADGMEGRWFLNALGSGPCRAIKALSKRGWVDSTNNRFTIHPVIRLVCREELKPTDETCGPFLRGLDDQYDPKEAYDKEKYRQLAETFTLASTHLEDRKGDWALWAGLFWDKLGEAKAALDCNQKVVQKLEKFMPDSPNLATAHNNLGSTYDALGDYEKALEHKLKAVTIFKEVLHGDPLLLATYYNNVGLTYGDRGKPETALEYHLKALEIFEKVLPGNHPTLATSYNNMGLACGHRGDYGAALKYQMKALTICEAVLPENHPDLAGSYNNVGMTYGNLGKHEEALKYKMKALEICEKVLPGNHPHLAASYNNVGATYGELGKQKEKLKYLLKALNIFEKALPGNHPDLADSCGNIAITYAEADDFDRALVYIHRAVQIADRPGQPHPRLAAFRQTAERMELMKMTRSMGMNLPNPFK